MIRFCCQNVGQFTSGFCQRKIIFLALSRSRQWKYCLLDAPQFPQQRCFLQGSRTWPFVILVGVTGKLIWLSSIGNMMVTKENRSTWRKTCPDVVLSAINLTGQCWDRTRACPVTGRRQTAWMMAQPKDENFPKLPCNTALNAHRYTHLRYKTN